MENPSQSLTMDTPRDARSSSAFLQDMIKEKKSQTQRIGRSRDVSGSSHLRNISGREFHSSPNAPPRDRTSTTGRRPSGSRPQGAPKEMGLREMQEHISRIDKQNFDLKLEIFHRRQKCEALESKIARLEPLQKENEELKAENEDLIHKLERNDEDIETREIAIEEAVGMICELEAKVEDYANDLEKYRAVVDAEVAPPPPVHSEALSSTPSPIKSSLSPSLERSGSQSRHPAIRRVASIASGPKSPLRPPSFLHDNRKSNTALRSLYSSANPSVASFHRDSGAYSDSDPGEELDRQMMASPRLSILSETGFSSIMGHTRDDSAGPSDPVLPESNPIMPNVYHEERLAQRQARINQWVEDSKRQEPPKTPVRQPSQKPSSKRYSSIGELLDHPAGTTEPQSEQYATASNPSSGRAQEFTTSSSHTRSPSKSLRRSARAHDKIPPPIIAGSPFNSSHLPPTPETMSTATIGGNSSTQSIVTERSLAEGTILPTDGYTNIVNNGRPNTSDRKNGRRLSNSNGLEGRTVDFGKEEVMSTRVEQGGVSDRDQGGLMGGSLKTTRFFGAEAPRRPVLNTHVTDMMFNGDGFSPKHASRTVSYPSAPRRRSFGAPSPTSQRSSGGGSSRTVTSPRRTQPSPTKIHTSPSPPQRFADMAQDVDDDDSKPRHTSSLRFRLPKRHAPSNNNIQSVTSRIFKRNKAPPAEADLSEEDAQDVRPSSGPRPGRSSTTPAIPQRRPGTADGSTAQELPRQNADNKRWTLMRRHSAVLDDSFMHDDDKDEESGLRRVAESRATIRAGDEGRFKNAKAMLRDGFGLRR